MADSSDRVFHELESGLFAALAPCTKECDDRITALETAQSFLSKRIEGLEQKLQVAGTKYMNKISTLPSLKERATQLQNLRKRVIEINRKLSTIERRVKSAEEKLVKKKAECLRES